MIKRLVIKYAPLKFLKLHKKLMDVPISYLTQMVPTSVAKKMKDEDSYTGSDFFKSVTIMFTDIFGFGQLSLEMSPTEVVIFLNNLYNVMDERINNYEVYKVETINDSYMVASGTDFVFNSFSCIVFYRDVSNYTFFLIRIVLVSTK